jgi:hypothetical protein
MKKLVLVIIPALKNVTWKNVKCLAILLLVAGFFSCDRPVCKNKNPIFDDYQPISKEYKQELIHQLSIVDKSKLRYWFKEYAEYENNVQLHFYIQSKELCAVLVLDVEQWNKLEHFRKVKGGGYRGAEFKKLQFEIEQDTINPKFVYRDFSKIID